MFDLSPSRHVDNDFLTELTFSAEAILRRFAPRKQNTFHRTGAFSEFVINDLQAFVCIDVPFDALYSDAQDDPTIAFTAMYKAESGAIFLQALMLPTSHLQ